MTIWSDTPPTVAGWYWVKWIQTGNERPSLFDGEIWYGVANYYTQAMAARALFGQRIPSADQLIELQRKAEELDLIHAAWGLKNN